MSSRAAAKPLGRNGLQYLGQPDDWSIAVTQGYVFVYRPTLGTGMIVTDTGDEVPFLTEDKGVPLEGGDVVQLEPAPKRREGGPAGTSRIRIVEKGSRRLVGSSPSLLRELCSAIENE